MILASRIVGLLINRRVRLHPRRSGREQLIDFQYRLARCAAGVGPAGSARRNSGRTTMNRLCGRLVSTLGIVSVFAAHIGGNRAAVPIAWSPASSQAAAPQAAARSSCVARSAKPRPRSCPRRAIDFTGDSGHMSWAVRPPTSFLPTASILEGECHAYC